ncbi:MAG: DUF3793 family protein [Selenomonadaceae bacterium]|nr:DUF3793 family protein [Selenomonadaceae bacterium]
MGRRVFEHIVGSHAALTLLGIKPGSLVSFKKSDFDDFDFLLSSYRRCFACKGISVCILSENKEYAHIFLYRRSLLEEALKNEIAREILLSLGYPQNIFLSLAYLKRRYSKDGAFPHEIGLFLGYPPEDVKGFIENKGRNFLLCAYWKVYVNEQEAKKIFEKYASCAKKFCDELSGGASILDLSVKAC